jgi:hypothetical protein
MRQTFLNSLLRAAILITVSIAGFAQVSPCSGLSLGREGSLNGFLPFRSNSLWNTNIYNAPLDPNSNAIINFIGSGVHLHPDFGAGLCTQKTNTGARPRK